MNIFEYAMKMEKEGEDYYRDLATKAKNDGLATILNWLADEEAKHHKTFKAMKSDVNPKLAETTLLKDAKTVFQKIKDSKESYDFDSSQPDWYRTAQDLEKKSMDFYLQKSEEVESQEQKDLFVQVAEEEKRHYVLLESIIEFVTRPDSWLEDAEFHHLEEF